MPGTPALINGRGAADERRNRAGPALARGAVRRECDLVVLDTSDMLHDALAPRALPQAVNPRAGFSWNPTDGPHVRGSGAEREAKMGGPATGQGGRPNVDNRRRGSNS